MLTTRRSHLAPGLEVDISYDTSDAIDPSTICPFCDEPWPSDPSAELTNLLARARRKAWPHKRYTNPEGLKAPLEAIIDLCNTHRSEASIIPEGIAKGWPSEIDFDAIPNRLWKLKPALQKLIDFPSGWHFFDIAKKDIQQFGAAATNSTRGQFSTFSRTQPGYYGERGLVRIANGLHDLFPGLSTRPSFAPLDVENFLLRVLIPETARLLIMEDLALDEADALSVLRESQKYGVAKFPDRGEEDALEKFGVSMRVRLKLGQERHLADTKEAERELRTERRKTKKNKHDLPPEPDATSLTQGEVSGKSRTGSRPPLVDIPSPTTETSSLDMYSEQASQPKKKKKRTILGEPPLVLSFSGDQLSTREDEIHLPSNSGRPLLKTNSVGTVTSRPSSIG
ncbi:RTC4-like domain-containing protein [Cantharellus anzutake]|uniref:RTC4-like domain-containing protein n=1 Tax=Cantharellus anzutake TaxID=1750568 RepID=UPI001906CE06|nr:RTC4-like domain-containing protein [Cantharellus anzutake]KAF8328450.1 RTC4-like domain-containing protein [Cantharellus anzutake]